MSTLEYRVLVYRDGRTLENPDDTGAAGANTGIRIGDRVEVTITQEPRGYIVARLHAGAGYRCGV